jgi:hypothetical protein
VGRLRGYGNAIVAEVAEAFIGAFMDVGANCAAMAQGENKTEVA